MSEPAEQAELVMNTGSVGPVRCTGSFRVERVAGLLGAEEVKSPTAVSYTWNVLNADGQSEFPSGLVDVSLRFQGLANGATGKFYFRVGDTFRKRDFSWFKFGAHGIVKFTMDMPAGVRGCAVVVSTRDGELDLVSASVKQISRLRRLSPRAYDLIRDHIKHPQLILSKLKQAVVLLRKGGIEALRSRLANRENYLEWVLNYDTITDQDRARMKLELESFKYKPLISILLPVYNVPERFLHQAIESVRAQIYPNWELCIADDNSPNPEIKEIIALYAKCDARIKFVARTENGHISRTTNSAAELASGEFYGFLDHDDELREHALFMVARELNRYPDADLIYSDEDKISDLGVRFNPYFKSTWNPELILTHNFICHFKVVRAELFKRLAGLRPECDGAQDWDLVLRISENSTPDRIRHIPLVLYHWRVIEGSTAGSASAKPYVTEAQRLAISEHLARRGHSRAQLKYLPHIYMWRVKYPVPSQQPLVSIVIPTHNQVGLLSRCVTGLLGRTDYKNLEVVIVDNRSNDPETLTYLREVVSRDSRIKVLRDDEVFNFARINNDAVKQTRGEIVCFLNNDIEVIHPDWLDEMVSQLTRDEVGAVGARLLFPDGTVQHAGVITGIGGVAGNAFRGHPASGYGYFCRAILQQNLSAVTAACMLVKRDIFDRVGGFDEQHLAVAFNDIDLCLKIHAEGKLIVYTPYAELLHHESVSRGYEDTPEKIARFDREYKTMQQRWGDRLTQDPYYNPNLLLKGVGFELGTARFDAVGRP